ncbi:hypothetical protein EJB05_28077 [Eragrostis curvula]|nr:hypothetical protein EJB05_32228 [Eragrostis curvula]TVU25576.1 hypothetical protein EJB05_28077 [Eragrostis curvula]
MTGKTPLHMAAEMVSPDMVSVLLDHHADPNARTLDGVTPLHVLRGLTSEFLFEGVVSGLTHMDPNKLRLCLELVHSAVMVTTRDEGAAAAGGANFPMASHKRHCYNTSNVYNMDEDLAVGVFTCLYAVGSLSAWILLDSGMTRYCIAPSILSI